MEHDTSRWIFYARKTLMASTIKTLATQIRVEQRWNPQPNGQVTSALGPCLNVFGGVAPARDSGDRLPLHRRGSRRAVGQRFVTANGDVLAHV